MLLLPVLQQFPGATLLDQDINSSLTKGNLRGKRINHVTYCSRLAALFH